MRRIRNTALAVLIAFTIAACAQEEVPKDRYYRLEVPPAASQLGAPRLPGVLEVQRLEADGLVAGRPLVYALADDPLEIRDYHYHFWAQAPASMLQNLLVSYLRSANVAARVVTPEHRVSADHAVTGRIKRMERVIGPQPRVILDLELGLRNEREVSLVMLESYHVEAVHDEDSVPAAVHALNTALVETFDAFLTDVLAATGP